MASLKEVNVTAANGAENESPAEEEQPFYETSERRHVESLLDISEEEFLKELEPFEYHCHNGWEEAVRGWVRVDPLSCILVTPRTSGKTKHKEAANLTPSSVISATPPNADNSSSRAKPHCEPLVGRSSSQKSTQLNQHITAMAAPQREAPEWPVINALQEATSNLSFREKVEQEGGLRETHHTSKQYVSENKTSKPQKHSHRPNSTAVPIKNFTFLPPITPSQSHPQRNCGGKASEKGSTEGNCFIFDNRSRTRGAGVHPAANPKFSASPAALTSKHQPCQHNPYVFSVSIPKRYQVPASPKPERLHRTIYSTRALHSSTAAN